MVLEAPVTSLQVASSTLESHLPRHSSSVRSHANPPRLASWSNELNDANHAALSGILTCLPWISPHHDPAAPARCRTNMLTVILGANWWLDLVLLNGGESGECVWLRTMVETLRDEGYTFLSVFHQNYAGMIKLYAAIPDIM